MATVRVETIQPEPPPRKVIIELTEDEAAAVYIMCGSVGGPMSTPLRCSATDVWLSLNAVFSDNEAMCVEWGSIKPTDRPLPRLR